MKNESERKRKSDKGTESQKKQQKMRPIVKVLLNRLTRLRKAHTCSGSAVSVSICSAWISATWMQTALMRHMKTAC